jgi:hypothetical protein
MNEPPAKRRRTSSASEQPSSPLRRPPRRPSFASPTKASLARNYPNLLTSVSPRRNRQGGVLATHGFRGREESEAELPSESDEQELPGTPLQNDRATSKQPRRGILFSSPSKRPPRVRDPVKQPPLSSRAPAVQSDDFTGSVEDGPLEDTTQELGNKRQPPDPEIERRKQERARLQREVEELESQVSRCIEEVTKEQRRGPEDSLQPLERDSLK